MPLALQGPDCPALWSRARELTAEDREMHQGTIKLMQEAMTKVGAAGIAANQVGIPLRFFVTKYPTFPVVINPTWFAVGDQFISKPERCLSNLDFTTFVRRPAQISARWLDGDGSVKTARLEGMDARVFMHLEQLLNGTPIFPRPLRPCSTSLHSSPAALSAPSSC